MSQQPAIRVEHLCKEYQIGGRDQSYKTLRESLTNAVTRSFRRKSLRKNGSADRNRPARETIWALNEVTFDVQRGDVVAIIGRNGAGKSTLLKVLSRITEPTRGHADVYGRVGSLLEVGTGFHPELTGRENIFLNGSILGMSRSEIEKKFACIVDFAGVEKFIDTPVKHYSSGMYLRLAFAVASHMEPEILLVDEVLAVGDIAFQQKCLGRMGEVADEGRTVLFVSHNMSAVRSLCNRGVYLEDGKVAKAGDVTECISRYFHSIGAMERTTSSDNDIPAGTGFRRVLVNNGRRGNTIAQSEGFCASTALRLRDRASGFYLYCLLEDMQGRSLFAVGTTSQEMGLNDLAMDEYQIDLELPPLWLVPGLYSLYFKAVIWGRTGSKHLSDKFPLDVQGVSSSSTQDRILHPQSDWTVSSAKA